MEPSVSLCIASFPVRTATCVSHKTRIVPGMLSGSASEKAQAPLYHRRESGIMHRLRLPATKRRDERAALSGEKRIFARRTKSQDVTLLHAGRHIWDFLSADAPSTFPAPDQSETPREIERGPVVGLDYEMYETSSHILDAHIMLQDYF